MGKVEILADKPQEHIRADLPEPFNLARYQNSGKILGKHIHMGGKQRPGKKDRLLKAKTAWEGPQK